MLRLTIAIIGRIEMATIRLIRMPMKSLLEKWSTFPIIKPPIKVAPFVASEYTTEKINTVITFAIISEAGDTGTVLIFFCVPFAFSV